MALVNVETNIKYDGVVKPLSIATSTDMIKKPKPFGVKMSGDIVSAGEILMQYSLPIDSNYVSSNEYAELYEMGQGRIGILKNGFYKLSIYSTISDANGNNVGKAYIRVKDKRADSQLMILENSFAPTVDGMHRKSWSTYAYLYKTMYLESNTQCWTNWDNMGQGNYRVAGYLNTTLIITPVYYLSDDRSDYHVRNLPTQIRYVRDWLCGSSVSTGSHWVEIQAFDSGGTNRALNKSVYSSWGSTSGVLVDGATATGSYIDGPVSTNCSMWVDLGALYTIPKIKVWHYHGDNRMFFGTKTEVSPDGYNWYPFFDSSVEGLYIENSLGKLHDRTYKTTIPKQFRYIRDTANGSTSNSGTHWVEIKAFNEAGTNIALNKTTSSSWGGVYPVWCDGSIDSASYAGIEAANQWIKIDLGALYTIPLVKVWHYYADKRIYYQTKTEVSVDNVNWIPIYDSLNEGLYRETLHGNAISTKNLEYNVV